LFVGLGAMLAVILIGCTGPADSDSEGHPAETASGTGPGSSDVQPRDDLLDEHALEWSRTEQLSDKQLRVYFFMGNPKCYGARAEVDESPKAIKITVIEGRLPNGPTNCVLDATEASILIMLDAPIATRSITPP